MQQYMNIRKKKINIPKRVIVSLANFEILLYTLKENVSKKNKCKSLESVHRNNSH